MNFRSYLVNLGDVLYYRILSKELADADSVLDVGCGDNSPLAKIKKHFYAEGVDIFAPSLKKSKAAQIHDRYQKGNVLEIDKLYKEKSFDVVVALDLIEHLTKKQGYKLIEKMTRIARKKVIIMTPNGFYKQNKYGGNPWQIHRSGWKVNEFTKIGFKVRGIRGLKYLRGEYATLRWKPWFLWGMVSVMTELIVYFLPHLAYQLFVVKKVEP